MCPDRNNEARKADFLLELYRQTSVHLGRHISGVWQCVGVVGAALAALAIDKTTDLNDYICTLAIILCGWLTATTLDASNWFNRNLTIVGNIERHFLEREDLKLIHPFFEKHREPGRHAKHFTIQLWLSAVVSALILVYHFVERLHPRLESLREWGQPTLLFPYAAGLLALAANLMLANYYREKDADIKRRAPGRII
jgi:hypothetical protein